MNLRSLLFVVLAIILPPIGAVLGSLVANETLFPAGRDSVIFIMGLLLGTYFLNRLDTGGSLLARLLLSVVYIIVVSFISFICALGFVMERYHRAL